MRALLDPSSGFRDRSDILMTPLGGDVGVGTQTDGRELFSAAAHSVVWFYDVNDRLFICTPIQ